ncbi:hypothetical protein OH786_03210 [Streptomyces atratus]|uniref:hypothetical protein n=1 Tax=Streptomyces atratus TaxID=1893 RepID=UPI00092FDD84|nr:hypothetical protein [Streptomyces atratus]
MARLRERRSASSAGTPPAASARALARKIAGIILYVEPFPAPLRTKSATDPPRKQVQRVPP